MVKLDPKRLIFGLWLIGLIVIGGVTLAALQLPNWPAFLVMIFFFIEHMEIKKAPHVIVGGLFGLFCLLLFKPFL